MKAIFNASSTQLVIKEMYVFITILTVNKEQITINFRSSVQVKRRNSTNGMSQRLKLT